MKVMGELKAIISKKAQSIYQATLEANDYNIIGFNIRIITSDGRVHNLQVHDYEIDWQDDEE